MWLDFERTKQPKFKDPVMIVAVSTSMPQYRALYSQARELAEYLLRKMEFEKIATVRSSSFPPEVLVRGDGLATLPACHFYAGGMTPGPVLFAGDASPMDEQHEFAEFLLGYCEEIGAKELYSVGARWADNPVSPEAEPQPNGFATDGVGVENLRRHGVNILSEEPAPFFSSMVVAMAKERGIRGYKLSVDHGEPSPHARSVAKLLEVLSGMVGFDVDLEELRAQAKKGTKPSKTGDGGAYH